jgi:hypothetical protein
MGDGVFLANRSRSNAMNPRDLSSETPGQDVQDNIRIDDETAGALDFEKADWDAIESGGGLPDNRPAQGELPGEDDDNPFQESDEALPDDREESALRRDPSKEGSRFGEV